MVVLVSAGIQVGIQIITSLISFIVKKVSTNSEHKKFIYDETTKVVIQSKFQYSQAIDLMFENINMINRHFYQNSKNSEGFLDISRESSFVTILGDISTSLSFNQTLYLEESLVTKEIESMKDTIDIALGSYMEHLDKISSEYFDILQNYPEELLEDALHDFSYNTHVQNNAFVVSITQSTKSFDSSLYKIMDYVHPKKVK